MYMQPQTFFVIICYTLGDLNIQVWDVQERFTAVSVLGIGYVPSALANCSGLSAVGAVAPKD